MKLEYNTKMFVSIKCSRQLCRLYVLKWSLPFLSSPHHFAPHSQKGSKALQDSGSLSCSTAGKFHCVFPVTTRDASCFLTAFVPTCDLQWAYSWLQSPLGFLPLVSYGTDSAAPTMARLPLRAPANPYKGRNPGAVRGRVCLAALWLHLQSLN